MITVVVTLYIILTDTILSLIQFYVYTTFTNLVICLQSFHQLSFLCHPSCT